MVKNKWFVPALVVLGLLFMSLSWFMSTRLERQSSGLKALARVVYNSGEVYVLHKNMTEKETLTKSAILYYLDTVETGPNGDATFELDSGYRVRVLDNALITLDQDGEKAIFLLKRGDVQIESFGTPNMLMISKNGQRYTPSDYEVTVKRTNAQGNFPEMAPVANTPTTAAASGDTLSSDYIQDTLKRQIPAFDKCYKQMLQRTPGIVGQVVMTFTIERSGKIVSADVSTSTINNQDFKRCLTEGLRRIEFKSFSGDPITSTFPIGFE
ncbi:AgmX/PglI C-terminal domain-containing protein [Bdellovibrio sp. HCB337]|uniref:AgmX/PglI C-terminal domain-containing protein n=1 Tax=Bdellovibrio sp. HCB337 TaxID=3394358 RepID=UPI0039A474A3